MLNCCNETYIKPTSDLIIPNLRTIYVHNWSKHNIHTMFPIWSHAFWIAIHTVYYVWTKWYLVRYLLKMFNIRLWFEIQIIFINVSYAVIHLFLEQFCLSTRIVCNKCTGYFKFLLSQSSSCCWEYVVLPFTRASKWNVHYIILYISWLM